jgi:hypothetical protein
MYRNVTHDFTKKRRFLMNYYSDLVAPENVVIDRTFIEVEEGSTGGYLECLASAYPQANYYWQYNHQIIGNGPRLTLDYGLSRDKTGEYSCVAHNQHGNSSAKAFINVVCK